MAVAEKAELKNWRIEWTEKYSMSFFDVLEAYLEEAVDGWKSKVTIF